MTNEDLFLRTISGINDMVELVNQETIKYNAMPNFSKEKMVLATEINSANIQILNKKFDLIITHIQDIYQRLESNP